MDQTLRVAIDIGNTRIKCAVFQGSNIVDMLTTEHEEDLQRFLQGRSIASAIVSDVRGNTTITENLSAEFTVIAMSPALKLPIQNNYTTPQTLGSDRIAAAVGAQVLYKTTTIIVIDAGTCITTGFVHQHIYEGGSISPGIAMRYKALHHYTGKLPLIEHSNYADMKPIGDDTASSIHSGVLAGVVYEIESRVAAIIKTTKLNETITIVTTGGDGAFLAEQLKYSNFASSTQLIFEPNLVLIGLNEILLLNES